MTISLLDYGVEQDVLVEMIVSQLSFATLQ